MVAHGGQLPAAVSGTARSTRARTSARLPPRRPGRCCAWRRPGAARRRRSSRGSRGASRRARTRRDLRGDLQQASRRRARRAAWTTALAPLGVEPGTVRVRTFHALGRRDARRRRRDVRRLVDRARDDRADRTAGPVPPRDAAAPGRRVLSPDARPGTRGRRGAPPIRGSSARTQRYRAALRAENALDFDDLVGACTGARCATDAAAACAVARTLLDAARGRGAGPRSVAAGAGAAAAASRPRHLPRGRRRPDHLCMAARRRAADPRPRGCAARPATGRPGGQLPLPGGGRRARRSADRARAGALRQGDPRRTRGARPARAGAGSRRPGGPCPPVARCLVRTRGRRLRGARADQRRARADRRGGAGARTCRTRAARTGCFSATTRCEPFWRNCEPPTDGNGPSPISMRSSGPWTGSRTHVRQSLLSWASGLDCARRRCRTPWSARRRATADLRRDDARLVLATMHTTKGLEFDHVAVIGLDDGGFPSDRTLSEAEDRNRALEEERRSPTWPGHARDGRCSSCSTRPRPRPSSAKRSMTSSSLRNVRVTTQTVDRDVSPQHRPRLAHPALTREQWLISAGIMSALALAALDATVVGTAMPTIIGQSAACRSTAGSSARTCSRRRRPSRSTRSFRT